MMNQEKWRQNTKLILYNLHTIRYYLDFAKRHILYLISQYDGDEESEYWENLLNTKIKDLEIIQESLVDEMVRIIDEEKNKRSKSESLQED